MNSYRFIISGKVQGVSYRSSVKELALKSNFKGYVKNLTSGDVEACITTNENQLDKFIEILNQGSALSIVDNIKQLDYDELFTNNFEIR